MEQVILRFWNGKLKIGMADWRTIYLLHDGPVKLIPETYKGNLVYRLPGSTKRFSYASFKKE